MAISHGLTSAIMNPLHTEARSAVLAADMLMNQDPNCAAWIADNRPPNPEGAEGARAGARRRGGRRARTNGAAAADEPTA